MTKNKQRWPCCASKVEETTSWGMVSYVFLCSRSSHWSLHNSINGSLREKRKWDEVVVMKLALSTTSSKNTLHLVNPSLLYLTSITCYSIWAFWMSLWIELLSNHHDYLKWHETYFNTSAWCIGSKEKKVLRYSIRFPKNRHSLFYPRHFQSSMWWDLIYRWLTLSCVKSTKLYKKNQHVLKKILS